MATDWGAQLKKAQEAQATAKKTDWAAQLKQAQDNMAANKLRQDRIDSQNRVAAQKAEEAAIRNRNTANAMEQAMYLQQRQNPRAFMPTPQAASTQRKQTASYPRISIGERVGQTLAGLQEGSKAQNAGFIKEAPTARAGGALGASSADSYGRQVIQSKIDELRQRGQRTDGSGLSYFDTPAGERELNAGLRELETALRTLTGDDIRIKGLSDAQAALDSLPTINWGRWAQVDPNAGQAMQAIEDRKDTEARSAYKDYYNEYLHLMEREDFAEKSRYKSTATGEAYEPGTAMYGTSGYGDLLYDYINKNRTAVERKQLMDTTAGFSALGIDDSFPQTMTGDEVKIYNYLYATEGRERANEYLQYLHSSLTERQRQETQQWFRDYARENPVAASAFSVLQAPMRGLSFVGQTADLLTDGRIDQNAAYNKFADVPNVIRQTVAENWGAVGSLAYQVGMSMADFLLTLGIGGGSEAISLGIMGSGAAANTVIDAKDRGLSDAQAYGLGLIAGTAEIMSEKISIEALLNMTSMGKNAIGYVVKNALSEGGEEVASSLANLMADIIISRDESRWKKEIDRYYAQGMSRNEAINLAIRNQAKNLGADFIGGFASGGIMAGGAAGVSAANNAVQNRVNAAEQQYAPMVGAMQINNAWQDLMAEQEAQQAQPQEENAQVGIELVQNDAQAAPQMQTKTVQENEQAQAEAEDIMETSVQTQEETVEEGMEADGYPTEWYFGDEPDSYMDIIENDPAYVELQNEARAGNIATEEVYENNLLAVVKNNPEARKAFEAEVIAPAQQLVAEIEERGAKTLDEAVQLRNARETLESWNNTLTDAELDPNPLARQNMEVYDGGQDPDTAGGERRSGARTGEQTAGVERGAGKPATVKQSGVAGQRRTRISNFGVQKVNLRSAGVAADAEATIYPEETWDAGMRNTYNRMKELGHEVVFVSGVVSVRGERVNGLNDMQGHIVVQADSNMYTVDQIADHEAFHSELQDRPGLREDLMERIAAKFSKEELDRIVARYFESYRGVANFSENMSEDEWQDMLKYVWDEILCDAWAEKNSFGYGATKFTETVRTGYAEKVHGRDADENVDVRGPPTVGRFSMAEPVEQTDTLIAMHNMTEEKLRRTLDLGAWPAPSIAIVRAEQGHEDYGDYSAVFPRKTIDPKEDRRNRVYGSDAWTPTHNDALIESEVNYDAAISFDNMIYDLSSKFAGGTFAHSSRLRGILSDESTNKTLDDVARSLAKSEAVQAAYLQERGETLEPAYEEKVYGDFGSDMLEKLIETVGPQELDRLNRKPVLENEDIERVKDVIMEKLIAENEDSLRQEPGLREIQIQEMRSDIDDYTVRMFIGSAWAHYVERGENTNQIDREATAQKMIDMILPGARRSEVEQVVQDWVRPKLEGILGESGIYSERGRLTNRWRRSFRQTHYPVTAENIVRAMYEQRNRRGNGANAFDAIGLASVTTPEYRSVSEIHADEERLRTEDDEIYEELMQGINAEIRNFIERTAEKTEAHESDPYMERYNIAKVLTKAAGQNTVKGVQRVFRKEGYRIPTELAQAAMDLYNKAAATPTKYFEAKPERVVEFGEALALIAPDDAPARLMQRMKDAGMNVITYAAGDEASRIRALNGVSGAKFSVSDEMDSEYAPTFYSHMERVIENTKQEKLGAASVVSMLKGKGVKNEEIKWSGIETFLEGKKSVTKQELLEFMRGNQLQIEEVALGEPSYTQKEQDMLNQANEDYENTAEMIDGMWEELFGEGTPAEVWASDVPARKLEHEAREKIQEYLRNNFEALGDAEFYNGFIEKRDRIMNLIASLQDVEDIRDAIVDEAKERDGAQWSDYATPGGARYREYLFKMPGSEYTNRAMEGHWKRGGILAHARVQDFDHEDGTVLFIEEIQSDWHNAGQKHGYRLEGQKDAGTIRKESEEAYNEFYGTVEKFVFENSDWMDDDATFYAHPVVVAEMFEGDESQFDKLKFDENQRKTIRKMVAEEKARSELLKTAPEAGSAPDAPYAKTYHEFVLKNLLRKAAEGGYAYLAWTPGWMQEERWSSEFAEGYRIEYDQDIPKFLNKYGKQWGAKTGEIWIGGDGTYSDIRKASVDVEMDADVFEGEEGNYVFTLVYDGEETFVSYTEKELADEGVDTSDENAVLKHLWKDYAGDDASKSVPAIPITESMKRSVLYEGQPMYSVSDEDYNESAMQYYALQEQQERERAAQKKEQRAQKRKERQSRLWAGGEIKSNSIYKGKPTGELLKTFSSQYSQEDFRNELMRIFSVPKSMSFEAKSVIRPYIQKILDKGALNDSDANMLFDTLYNYGVVENPQNKYLKGMSSAVQGAKIFVHENVKSDFGDRKNWNAFYRRAIEAGITITNDPAFPGIDKWNQEMATLFPGAFDAGDIRAKEILERIVSVAEEGKADNASLHEYAAMIADEYGPERVDEMFDNMTRQFDQAIRRFADKAGLEVRMRAREEFYNARERIRLADQKKAAQEERNRKELQNKLLKELQYLKKSRKKSGAEWQRRFDEVLTGIDTYATSALPRKGIYSKKYDMTWEDIANAYEEWSKEPDFLPNEDLKRIVSRVKDKKLADMTVEDLEDLLKTAVAIHTEYENYQNMVIEGIKTRTSRVYNQMVEEVKSADNAKREHGKVQHLMNLNQLTPMNIIQRVGGWNPDSTWMKLAKNLEQGEREQKAYVIRANDLLRDFMTKNKKWVERADGQSKNAKWYELNLPKYTEAGAGDAPIDSGETVTVYMTPAMKVHLYLESKNAMNLYHIEHGGRKFVTDKELYRTNRHAAMQEGVVVKLTPQAVREIVADLTPQEQELANLMHDYYNGMSREEINRVSNRLYGYDKAINEEYAPIWTDKDFAKQEPGVYNVTAEGVGSLKERLGYAATQTMNVSAFDAFNKSVDETSRFVGLSIPVKNWNTVMNWNKKVNQDENTPLTTAVRMAWGTETAEYLRDLTRDYQQPYTDKQTPLDGMVGSLMANYISSVFASNPSVVLKQLGSYPMAMAYLGASNAPTLKQIHKADPKLIAKYSPELDARLLGYDIPEVAQVRHKKKWTQKNKLVEDTLGGGWITAMDGWVAKTLWPWAENKVQKETGLEYGTDEFYKRVAQEFDNAVVRSQSINDFMHRSNLMKSTNSWARTFTMFKSDSAQSYNALREKFGVVQYMKKHGTEEQQKRASQDAAQAVLGVMANATWSTLITMIIGVLTRGLVNFEDDKGEFSWEEVGKDAAENMVSNLAGTVIGGQEIVDLIAPIIRKERYWGIEEMGTSRLNDFLTEVNNAGASILAFAQELAAIGKEDGDWGEFMEENSDMVISTVKDIAWTAGRYFAGLPVENIEKYLLGLMRPIFPEAVMAIENLQSKPTKASLKGLEGEKLKYQVGSILDNIAGGASDETVEELSRLYELNDVPTETVEMTPAQERRYRLRVEEILSEHLDAFVASTRYQEMDDEERGNTLNWLNNYANKTAKAEVLGKEEESITKKINALMDKGMEMPEALAAYDEYERAAKMLDAGLDPELSADVVQAMHDKEDENGPDVDLSDLERYELVLDYIGDEAMRYASLAGMMDEKELARFTSGHEWVSSETYIKFLRAFKDKYPEENKSQERVEIVLKSMDLDRSERAALWQMSGKNWKAENNPFDWRIGEEIFSAVEAAYKEIDGE